MMTKLRQASKTFLIILVLAFLALIVGEWGADMGGIRTDNVIGEVNGEELTYDKWRELYSNLYENERARTEGQIDDRRLEQLREQVWEQFVQITLFREEMKNLNIAVTDSEVVYQIMNHPLPEFRNNPQLQTNGSFDMAKYRQLLQDPNLPWRQIEEYYRQQIPFEKLRNIITNSVRVSELEILDEYKRKNLKAKVEYLAILAARFQDNVEVSETEIENFYRENKEDYKRNAQRELAYVLFEVKPTAQDTQRIFTDFNRIRERMELGEDFSTLALEFSEDPSVNQNSGDLGYFDRSSMVKPFSDAAFAAEPGEIVGPVQTSFGYHLIKVEDKKTEDGEEKVKASHILLKVSAGPSTLSEQEDAARIFADDVQDLGWDAALQEYGYQPETTGFFEERGGFVPGFGRNAAISNFAFSKSKGSASDVYSVDQGYAVFRVNDLREEGYRPLDEVRDLVENRAKLEKAKGEARAFAANLSEPVAQGNLEAVAQSDTSGRVRYDVTPLFSMNQSIPNVGRQPEFLATAFTLNVGETSDMIEAEFGFYYQKLLEKTEFDSTKYLAQKEAIRSRLLNEKRNQVFTDWYDKLKEEADIVDNRRKFNLF